MEALGPDYGRLFRFMIATGDRASGALLTWSQVDRENRLARIRNKSRNGQQHWYTIPLTHAQLAILDECVGHHPVHVFTYTAERSRERACQGRAPANHGRRLQDALAPIRAGCLQSLTGFRRHDTRHTAGTRYVRATGNLKGAQRLLGHARIETTTRYAHVLLDDIRAGQEAVEAVRGTGSSENHLGSGWRG